MTSGAASFTGPLFVVGAPRSGTKLLRDLLNQHPRIGIPVAETHFIPGLVRRHGNPPRLEAAGGLEGLHREIRDTAFSWHMRRFGQEMPLERLEAVEDRSSWAAILEAVLRFYAPGGKAPGFIFGDKTPSYLSHLRLLKEVFPPARVVHIIRDPRDCCLSAKKAWGKSLYRTADTWRRTVEAARAAGRDLGPDYLATSFEALLEDPAGTLGAICRFAGCDLEPSMTELARAGENLGDAKGEKRIVASNRGKYRSQLQPSEVRRIEEIVFPVMEALPYAFEHATGPRPLGALHRAALRVYDKLQRLRFDVATKGLRDGLRFHCKLHR